MIEFKRKGIYPSKTKHDYVLESVRGILEANREYLSLSFPDHIFQIGLLSSQHIGIVVYLEKTNADLPDHLEDSKFGSTPLEQIIIQEFKSHSIFEYRLQNKAKIGNVGSIGFVVSSDTNDYILTCSHVVTNGNRDYGGYSNQLKTQKIQVLNDQYVKYLYNLSFAQMDSYIDAALIHISSDHSNWRNVLPNGKQLNYPIDIFHLKLGDRLYFYSSLRKSFKSFQISDRRCLIPLKIVYPDETTNNQEELIVLKGLNNQFSEGGDSGSILFDSYSRPVAMVIAGSGSTCLAISLSRLLNVTKTKMKKSL